MWLLVSVIRTIDYPNYRWSQLVRIIDFLLYICMYVQPIRLKYYGNILSFSNSELSAYNHELYKHFFTSNLMLHSTFSLGWIHQILLVSFANGYVSSRINFKIYIRGIFDCGSTRLKCSGFPCQCHSTTAPYTSHHRRRR